MNQKEKEIIDCLITYGTVTRQDQISSIHNNYFTQYDISIPKLNNIKDKDEAVKYFSKFLNELGIENCEFIFNDNEQWPYSINEFEVISNSIEIGSGGFLINHPTMTNCWCISFGVERLVMVKNNIPDIRHFYYDNFLLEHITENKIKQEIHFDTEKDKNKKIKKLLKDRETI